jgi:hypothetical protein
MWCHLSHHTHKYRKKLISDFHRKERRREAQHKLHSLALDQSNVLSAQQGGEGIVDVEKNFELLSHELTVDEYTRLVNTRARLQDDIEGLLDALAYDPDNIDALFRVIEAAGLLGRFMGPHPLQGKLATAEGRKKVIELRQREKRLEIMRPLVVEAREGPEPKSKKAPSIAKHIRPALEEKLKAKDIAIPKPATILKNVQEILKQL